MLLTGDLSSSQLPNPSSLLEGTTLKFVLNTRFLGPWDMPNIQKASNLELLIELMYDGESRMVESLVDEEPIDTGLICKLLASRTGRLPSNELEYWYEWFVDEATNEKTSDKDILKSLNDFKSNFDKPL